MNEYYMNIAIKEAKKAYKYEEVPVGALIVKNNKIIAKAFNKKEKTKNVTKHAEIIAISKACKKLKNWRLEDCTIYVTMEPCMMCSGAIEQSRIKKIVYGVKNENYGSTDQLKNIEIISQVCEKKCRELVQSFFKKRR
ncbi:MAG: nucleoside deaminase [Bacilli bacterium]|nr:nucleoside deaminase [Bacilli bacterium]